MLYLPITGLSLTVYGGLTMLSSSNGQLAPLNVVPIAPQSSLVNPDESNGGLLRRVR